MQQWLKRCPTDANDSVIPLPVETCKSSSKDAKKSRAANISVEATSSPDAALPCKAVQKPHHTVPNSLTFRPMERTRAYFRVFQGPSSLNGPSARRLSIRPTFAKPGARRHPCQMPDMQLKDAECRPCRGLRVAIPRCLPKLEPCGTTAASLSLACEAERKEARRKDSGLCPAGRSVTSRDFSDVSF